MAVSSLSSSIRTCIVSCPWFMALVVALTSLVPVGLCSGKEPGQAVDTGGALQGKQGAVLLVTIPVHDRPDRATGKFLQRTLTLFPFGEHLYAGLLGLDLDDRPGRHELTIDVVYPQRTERRRLSVTVLKATYPVQQLTLPSAMVDLDAATLARVKAEAGVIRQAFDGVVPHPLWRETFRAPVSGKSSGRFGSRRVINGQPKNPHSGEDIAAPEGTAVSVMNDGIVRLTMDHFFTGKGVIVDHGLGLFSMYFHLSRVDVEPGQTMTSGQVIGAVGSTGRATGPHLHWGVRLNGARVDPYSLLALDVGEPFRIPD